MSEILKEVVEQEDESQTDAHDAHDDYYDSRSMIPADNVDANGVPWPTIGENIRKGVNGYVAGLYNRMPDVEAVGEFWSKMLGKKCTAVRTNINFGDGVIIRASNLYITSSNHGIYKKNANVVGFYCLTSGKFTGFDVVSDTFQTYIEFSGIETSSFTALFIYC